MPGDVCGGYHQLCIVEVSSQMENGTNALSPARGFLRLQVPRPDRVSGGRQYIKDKLRLTLIYT